MLKVLVLLFLCRIIESKFWRTKENIKND
jgi:hypothetical protein